MAFKGTVRRLEKEKLTLISQNIKKTGNKNQLQQEIVSDSSVEVNGRVEKTPFNFREIADDDISSLPNIKTPNRNIDYNST